MTKQLTTIVTGGLQGIGRAIVATLKERGDAITVFDCVAEDDARVIDLTEQGVAYIRVDIGSHDSIVQAFTLFEKNNGPDCSLGLLVNNAGITKDGIAIRMNEDDWDRVLDVNLKGLFFCSVQALKLMMRKKAGYIINISSVVGLGGNAGQANYAASKAGVNSLTKTLAYEYGSRKICINALAPGFIETPLSEKLPDTLKEAIREKIALKRFGNVSDVANMVAFLSSGKADYITGAVISIDGGLH